MRLISKISLYHFLLSSLVLGLAGFLLFFFLRGEISLEIEEQLELQVDMIAKEMGKGKHIDFPLITVNKGNEGLMQLPKVFKDTLIYDYVQKMSEGYYYFAESKRINGIPYRIKVMTTYIGWENYSKTISYIFIAIATMLVILGTLVNYMISRSLWAPFLINLKRMKGYSVSSKEELQLAETDIKEFREMNTVLADLAARGKREYTALKEFTENASHEIQTPLTILKTRLESMGQFPLDLKLTRLLADAKIAVNRLSKVNKSLLLLAKLENGSFVDKTSIDFDQVIIRTYELLEDLFQQKRFKMTLKITKKSIIASSSLMDILVSNLLSNIIQYTQLGGRVEISLDEQQLRLSNESPPLTFPELKLFTRFTKGLKVNTDQNGLGLSIVRQICITQNWTINYAYQDGSHIFTIVFPEK